jgi:hypothetical protein
LETHKKFVKIEFSSVVAKRGICTRKVFISDDWPLGDVRAQ